MKKQQQGVSLIGLIFISAAIIALAVVGMKIAPSVMEYYTIIKHIKTIAGSGATSVAEIQKAYNRQSENDSTPSITGADLEITKEGSQVVISFEYSKKIHLFGNVSICIDYSGSSSGSKRPVV